MRERRSIFVSYRRSLDSGFAGRMADHLGKRFGESAVFMDVEALRAGRQYRPAIERALGEAVVLIAVIGPGWSTVTDDAGRRRLDDSDDLVVHEIGAALARGIAVVPVLLEAAELPRAAELPKPLLPLLDWQVFRLRHDSFRTEIGALIEQVAGLITEAEVAEQEVAGREAAERGAAEREAAQHEAAARETAAREEAQRETEQEEAAARRVEPTTPGSRVVDPVPPRGSERTDGSGTPGSGTAGPDSAATPTRPDLPIRVVGAPGLLPGPGGQGSSGIQWPPAPPYGQPVVGEPGAAARPAPARGRRSTPRSAEELFTDELGAPAGGWANEFGSMLFRATARVLPRSTPTAVLRAVVPVGPVLLLLALALAGVGSEAITGRPTGEPFVLDPGAGALTGLFGVPLVAAIIGFVLFWAAVGVRWLIPERGLRAADFEAAWIFGTSAGLAALLVSTWTGLSGLAWMVENQRISQTDRDGWVGLAAVVLMMVACWLSLVSWLLLLDREIGTSRAGPDRYFPVVVGALAAAVAGTAVVVDAQGALPAGWRWVDYLCAWTLLAACATALLVEATDRASRAWVFGAGIIIVLLAAAGSVLGLLFLR